MRGNCGLTQEAIRERSGKQSAIARCPGCGDEAIYHPSERDPAFPLTNTVEQEERESFADADPVED